LKGKKMTNQSKRTGPLDRAYIAGRRAEINRLSDMIAGLELEISHEMRRVLENWQRDNPGIHLGATAKVEYKGNRHYAGATIDARIVEIYLRPETGDIVARAKYTTPAGTERTTTKRVGQVATIGAN